MKKLCIICVLLFFGAMATAAVDPNLNPDISQLDVVYGDDFESGSLSNYDIGGSPTFGSSDPINGQYSQIPNASWIRTKTLGDTDGIQVIDSTSEMWVDSWVKIDGGTNWVNIIPQPMDAFSLVPVYFSAVVSESGFFEIAIKDEYASAGTFRVNYAPEPFELGVWHHFRIGVQIHDDEGNGKYTIMYDPNGTDTWQVLIENAEYATNDTRITSLSRVQWTIWESSPTYTMSVDELQVYAQPNPPEVCGDPGTTYYFMDFNEDCYVDMADFAQFASWWMECTDPADPVNCIAY